MNQILEGLWELANGISSYSSHLTCWVKLSQSYASWEPPRERGSLVLTTDNTPGVQNLFGRNDQRLSLVRGRPEAEALYTTSKFPPAIVSGANILCQIVVREWMFDILQPGRLTCPQNRVFYGSSAICVSSIHWKCSLKGKTDDRSLGVCEQGSCRPRKAIRAHKCHTFAVLVVSIALIPFWLWQRRFPDTRLKFINLPLTPNGPTSRHLQMGSTRPSLGLSSVRSYLLFICPVLCVVSEEMLGSLVEVRRKSGRLNCGCWGDSSCLPDSWAIFDGLAQASHRLQPNKSVTQEEAEVYLHANRG